MLPEDAILLPEIVDEIFLVAIHPASQSQHEEVQSVGHGRRLHGSDAAVTHVVSRIHSSRPFSRTIRDPSLSCLFLKVATHPFLRTEELLFEYACHEGNYSMTNILGGERALEKAASK